MIDFYDERTITRIVLSLKDCLDPAHISCPRCNGFPESHPMEKSR